jgi:hypothetical protein
MATRMKMDAVEAEIEMIDQMISDVTGIDYRKVAQDAIRRREAMRGLGNRISSAVGFDMADNQMVLVKHLDKFAPIH